MMLKNIYILFYSILFYSILFYSILLQNWRKQVSQFLKRLTFFPKIQTYFWHISESPKQHWISVPASFWFVVFDPKTRF